MRLSHTNVLTQSPLFSFARKLAKDKGHNYAMKYASLGELVSAENSQTHA